MKILLIGGTGQVGSEICAVAKTNNIEYIAPSSSELSITDTTGIELFLTKNDKIDFVVNASAYTAVDKAEDEPELAFSINRDGPRYLALACAKHKIPLLHISTDYIFDGMATIPYKENAPINPLGVYGASKAEGEQAVRDGLFEHIILRTAWVYGANGNNFVKTMLRLGRQHTHLKIVSDQVGCPTSAVDIAETIINVITQIPESAVEWGTYHYCSADSTNWADFARSIFEQAKLLDPAYPNVDVISIPSVEYPTKAARPNYSVLNCSNIEQSFSITLPLWLSSLQRNIPNILKYI